MIQTGQQIREAFIELEQKFLESEAANAVMREALECDAVAMIFDGDIIPVSICAEYIIGGSLTNGPVNCKEFYDKRKQALSTNAGKSLLAERDRLRSALEKLPYKDFVGRNDIDAAEFVDHSNDFMEAMEAAHKAIETPQPTETKEKK